MVNVRVGSNRLTVDLEVCRQHVECRLGTGTIFDGHCDHVARVERTVTIHVFCNVKIAVSIDVFSCIQTTITIEVFSYVQTSIHIKVFRDVQIAIAVNVLSHVHHDYPVQLDKWLFQWGAYVVHQIAGTVGLVLLRLAFLATALYAAATATKIRWDWTPHALLMVRFTIALLNRPYVRAELVTWAAIPLTLCLIPAITRGEKRGFALLVLLQALWANSHGYWVIGPLLWLSVGTGAAIQPLLAKTALAKRRMPRPAPERLRLWC